MSYKRNQVEEAIAHLFVPNCEKPPPELRSRTKRLLELDRSMGRRTKYRLRSQVPLTEKCKVGLFCISRANMTASHS
jgi:hypothetical protein